MAKKKKLLSAYTVREIRRWYRLAKTADPKAKNALRNAIAMTKEDIATAAELAEGEWE